MRDSLKKTSTSESLRQKLSTNKIGASKNAANNWTTFDNVSNLQFFRIEGDPNQSWHGSNHFWTWNLDWPSHCLHEARHEGCKQLLKSSAVLAASWSCKVKPLRWAGKFCLSYPKIWWNNRASKVPHPNNEKISQIVQRNPLLGMFKNFENGKQKTCQKTTFRIFPKNPYVTRPLWSCVELKNWHPHSPKVEPPDHCHVVLKLDTRQLLFPQYVQEVSAYPSHHVYLSVQTLETSKTSDRLHQLI